MIENKKSCAAELRHLENLMVAVEKRLTYFLAEFALEEDNPKPPMGTGSFENMSQLLIGIHEETVANRERLQKAQTLIHLYWGE